MPFPVAKLQIRKYEFGVAWRPSQQEGPGFDSNPKLDIWRKQLDGYELKNRHKECLVKIMNSKVYAEQIAMLKPHSFCRCLLTC